VQERNEKAMTKKKKSDEETARQEGQLSIEREAREKKKAITDLCRQKKVTRTYFGD